MVGSVVVDPLYISVCVERDVLDAFEMESRILWNFRFVVLSAVGISKSNGSNE